VGTTLEFTEKEADLIGSKDILALSTVSQDGWPHCVPVSYVYLAGKFYVPAGPKSKKIRNLMRNERATILVSDDESESGVMMESETTILTGSKSRKFKDYMRRAKGWQNDETMAIIVLSPLRKASWFLKGK
jgi:general stress protein 26